VDANARSHDLQDTLQENRWAAFHESDVLSEGKLSSNISIVTFHVNRTDAMDELNSGFASVNDTATNISTSPSSDEHGFPCAREI
jgi:hypothetical protein